MPHAGRDLEAGDQNTRVKMEPSALKRAESLSEPVLRSDASTISNYNNDSFENHTHVEPRRKQRRSEPEGSVAAGTSMEATVHNSDNSVRDMLTPLHLDIFLEILWLLDPLDLGSLAQTNQSLRAMILSPLCKSTWKISYSYNGFPECPPVMSQMNWLMLMYGREICKICGKEDCEPFDYALMGEICTSCKQKCLKTEEQLLKAFPGIDAEIFQLVVHTLDDSERNKLYLAHDVAFVSQLQESYQRDIRAEKPGAQQAFSVFMGCQKQYVLVVTEHAQKSREWLRDRWKSIEERDEKLYMELSRRFRGLGYLEKDIEIIEDYRDRDEGIYMYLRNYRRQGKITEDAWPHMRLALEPFVIQSMCDGLTGVFRRIVAWRRNVVEKLYKEYRLTLRPVDRPRLPPPTVVHLAPVFRTVVYDRIRTIDKSHLDEAARQLPDLILAYQASVKLLLLQAMHEVVKHDEHIQWPADTDEQLSLACSTFRWKTSSDTNYYSSAADVLAQLAAAPEVKDPYYDKKAYSTLFLRLQNPHNFCGSSAMIKWDPLGHLLIRHFICALGLEPATARPEDLDRADRLFFCSAKRCNFTTTPKKSALMSWRQLSPHYSKYHANGAEPFRICILTEPFRAYVHIEEAEEATPEELEDSDSDFGDEPLSFGWGCMHCHAFFSDARWGDGYRGFVIKHVIKSHAIDNPQENADFFHAIPEMVHGHSHKIEVYTPKVGSYKEVVIECPYRSWQFA